MKRPSIAYLNVAKAELRRQRLLSYITAVEALLGEQKAGTSLLTTRLARIARKTEPEGEIEKFFKKEIYDLRSALVHGKEELLDRTLVNTHLHETGKFTRRALLWFLHYLHHVLETTRNEGDLPNREELLSVLDLRTDTREKVKHLLKFLPPDFPRTPGWLDQ